MKSSRRRFLQSTFASAVAAAASGGLYRSAQAQGSPELTKDLGKYKGVELNVVSMPGSSRAMNDEAIKMFMERSGAVVRTVDYPMSEMITKYTTSFLSGKYQYDVIAILNENMSQFYKRLHPLDDLVVDPSYKFSEILPSLVNEFKGPDGKQYGIPVRWGSDIIHYRKDLFDKYKVKVPTTWDEYLEAAKALTVNTPEGKVYGTDLKLVKGYPGVWFFSGWNWAAGGDLTDDKYSKGFLDTDRAAAAAEMIRKLMPYAPPGAASVTQDEQITNFAQGRTAMSIAWSPYGFFYQDPKQSKVIGKVGWAVPPRQNGAKTSAGVRFPGSSLSRWSMMSAWGYSVTRNSPNVEAAAALVRFLASEDAQRQIAIKFGMAPVRERVFQDPAFQKALKDKSMDGWAEATVAAGKAGYAFQQYNGHHAEMVETIQVPIQEACIGTRPVRQCLKEAQGALDTFLKDVVLQRV